MRRFVEGADRGQTTLLPECLGDWVEDSNPVRAVDVFVEALDLADLGFDGVQPLATGRPAYHPSTLLKLYIYGYLNRVQSSRRPEREAGLELLPDFFAHDSSLTILRSRFLAHDSRRTEGGAGRWNTSRSRASALSVRVTSDNARTWPAVSATTR